MRKTIWMKSAVVVGALLAGSAFAEAPAPSPAPAQTPAPTSTDPQVQRGEYLVRIAGCNDCHTPLKMTPAGPVPDMSRMLSGHPEQLKMPRPPRLKMPWMATASATLTAWSGPWGISYAANLTPDKETGLGSWDEATFEATMHSGRHMGKGRPILPPMPWQDVAVMTSDDMKALWAYLRSIPAVKNHVPQAVIAPAPKAPPMHKGAMKQGAPSAK